MMYFIKWGPYDWHCSHFAYKYVLKNVCVAASLRLNEVIEILNIEEVKIKEWWPVRWLSG